MSSLTPTNLPDRHTSETALAIRSDQAYWDERQLAALQQLGLQRASRGDLEVFFHQCKRTGLDPFARQIYMISRGGRNGIQTAIDGFRVIADRACIERGWVRSEEDTVWYDKDGKGHTEWLAAAPPVAARYTSVIVTPNGPARFSAVARFDEYTAGTGLWKKMPALMVAKCAEALALRKAFPQDLSGIYTDEEMAQADAQPARQVNHEPAPQGVAAKNVKNSAYKVLVDAGVERDDAIAAVAATWDATGHGDAAYITDEQAAGFIAIITEVAAEQVVDAEVVEDDAPAEADNPFAPDSDWSTTEPAEVAA
jgi:phage recombination protein Bet